MTLSHHLDIIRMGMDRYTYQTRTCLTIWTNCVKCETIYFQSQYFQFSDEILLYALCCLKWCLKLARVLKMCVFMGGVQKLSLLVIFY